MGILETASTLMGCEKPLCRANGASPCCPEPPGVSLECWVVYSQGRLNRWHPPYCQHNGWRSQERR